MADEPKAPRKRAAKKAVASEDKKTSKKAGSIPVPLFQAAPTTKTVKAVKAPKMHQLRPVAKLKLVKVRAKSFAVAVAAVAEAVAVMAKRKLKLMKRIQSKPAMKVNQVMVQLINAVAVAVLVVKV